MRTNHETHEQSLPAHPDQRHRQREDGCKLASYDNQQRTLVAVADGVDHQQYQGGFDYQSEHEPRAGQFLNLLGAEPEDKAENRVSTQPQKVALFSKRGRMPDQAHKHEHKRSTHSSEQSHPKQALRTWSKFHPMFKVYAPSSGG